MAQSGLQEAGFHGMKDLEIVVHAQVPAEEPLITPHQPPDMPTPEPPVVPPDDPHRPDVEREPSIDPPSTEPPVVAPSDQPLIDPPPPTRM